MSPKLTHRHMSLMPHSRQHCLRRLVELGFNYLTLTQVPYLVL
jgi:hypothetical protein